MNLKIFEDLEQGTDEWHEVRRGIVTASVVGDLITPKTVSVANNGTSRSKVAELAAERITGHTESIGWSFDMERGHLDEPYARDAYAKYKGVDVTEVGFMTRTQDGYTIGYSPDGLIGDNGLIEIKSRKQQIQLDTILADEVPSENMAQLQTGLFVSGRDWCDYVSYSGGLPLYVTRIAPDPVWQKAIADAAKKVEEAIGKMIHDYTQAVEGLPMTERIDHFEEPEIF